MRISVKRWGVEKWLVNNEMYCGKFLILHPDKATSIHCHKEKHETFHVLEGQFEILFLSTVEKAIHKVLAVKGDTYEVPPHVYHSVKGLDYNNVILEISTHHDDNDSYRINDEELEFSGMSWDDIATTKDFHRLDDVMTKEYHLLDELIIQKKWNTVYLIFTDSEYNEPEREFSDSDDAYEVEGSAYKILNEKGDEVDPEDGKAKGYVIIADEGAKKRMQYLAGIQS